MSATGKLLKQMWNMGIQDKRVLSIISAMLKAEVAGIGFPQKGTPQGRYHFPTVVQYRLERIGLVDCQPVGEYADTQKP